jgi:hypothetical protein
VPAPAKSNDGALPVGEAHGDEVEVTFEEEVDRADFADLAPLPSYHTSGWLVLLPLALVGVLAWNTRWLAPARELPERLRRSPKLGRRP